MTACPTLYQVNAVLALWLRTSSAYREALAYMKDAVCWELWEFVEYSVNQQRLFTWHDFFFNTHECMAELCDSYDEQRVEEGWSSCQ